MYPKVKIEFMTPSDVGVTQIEYVSSSTGINLSNAPQAMVAGNRNPDLMGFQLSSSLLNGEYTYFGNTDFPGFISQALYTGSALNVSITFKVVGVIPSKLYVLFDTASGEYAPSFTLTNNQTADVISVSDNHSILVQIDISTLSVTDGVEFTLTVTSWSALNHSVKITNINGTFYEYEVYGSSLIDFRCSENLMDSQLSVSPGICEQYANITLYDRNQLLHDKAKEGTIEEDAQITLSVVDDNNNEKILGTYLASDWDIDSNSSVVRVNCRDKSYIFSQINVTRAMVATRTVDDLLTLLFSYATNVSWEYLDSTTQARCTYMVIPNSWWLASDLYTMLNKICAVGLLRIYWYIDRFIVGRCV